MKNLRFPNVLGAFIALMIACYGYTLMPNSEDWRNQVESRMTGAFLKSFQQAKKVKNGDQLPEVELMASDGRKVELASMTKGRVTILNFWASWCAPCLTELPSLAKLQEKTDILIMPISLDMQKTVPELAKIFKTEDLKNMRWFYDESGVLRKTLSLPMYPATYVLDKKGRIIYVLQGPADWASQDALDFIRSLN